MQDQDGLAMFPVSKTTDVLLKWQSGHQVSGKKKLEGSQSQDLLLSYKLVKAEA